MKLIDTSAWVEFLRRQGDLQVKQAVARLIQSDQAAYTCPIRFELLTGARISEEEDIDRALSLGHHFLFGPEDWREAALLERRLREEGFTIPRIDLFVATVAVRTGLTLICRDSHFDIIRKAFGNKFTVEQI